MNGPARVVVAVVFVMLTAGSALAQPGLQTPPQPANSAETSSWYLSGEPLRFEGAVYYKAGPPVQLIQNEMVRSGFYQSVPLYARTTVGPYSIVFVPLAGGFMQPYERWRSGYVAATSGIAFSETSTAQTASVVAQPPGPPTQLTPVIPPAEAVAPIAAAARPATPQRRDRVVGTAGAVSPRPRAAVGSAGRRASNGVFIDFDKQRWFNSGSAIPLDASRFTRIGEYHGLPVYVERAASPATIYIPVALAVSDVVTPYTKR